MHALRCAHVHSVAAASVPPSCKLKAADCIHAQCFIAHALQHTSFAAQFDIQTSCTFSGPLPGTEALHDCTTQQHVLSIPSSCTACALHPPQAYDFDAQAFSNLLWAMAKLRHDGGPGSSSGSSGSSSGSSAHRMAGLTREWLETLLVVIYEQGMEGFGPQVDAMTLALSLRTCFWFLRYVCMQQSNVQYPITVHSAASARCSPPVRSCAWVLHCTPSPSSVSPVYYRCHTQSCASTSRFLMSVLTCFFVCF